MSDTNTIRTRRRAFLGSAALGLTALAGCSGSDDPPQSTVQPTTERTTGAGPQLEEVSLPTGVTEDEVPPDLLVSHQHVLADTSYTVTEEWIENGQRTETTLRLDRNRYVQEQTSLGPARDVWNEGGDGYVRVNGGETYIDLIRDVDHSELANHYELEVHLGAANFKPTSVTEEGDRTLIVAEADAADWGGDARSRYESIDAYEGTLSFTPEGEIAELAAAWEFTDHQGKAGAIEWRYTIEEVGETSVAEPDWVDRARAVAPEFAVTPAADGVPAVQVDVTGGQNALHSNLQLNVRAGPESHAAGGTQTALAAGDTMYVGLDEGGELVVRFDDPPQSLREIEGSTSFLLFVDGTRAIDTTVGL